MPKFMEKYLPFTIFIVFFKKWHKNTSKITKNVISLVHIIYTYPVIRILGHDQSFLSLTTNNLIYFSAIKA